MSGLSGVGVFWAFTSSMSCAMICVGYFLPYWVSGHMLIKISGKSEQHIPVHFGIFRRCNYPALTTDNQLTVIYECGRYSTFRDIPSASWQITTLTVGVGCGLCLLISTVSMFGVCIKRVVIATVARTAGVLQLCSALLMITGVAVYPNGWDSPEVRQVCGQTSSSYHLGTCSLSWCFYLTSVGIIITLLSSALAFHAPKRKEVRPENFL